MRYFFIFVFCLLIFSSCKNSNQEIKEIDSINFTYTGGNYIPYNELEIYLNKSDKETIVFKAFTEARLQAIYKNKQAIALKMLSFGDDAR